MRTGGEFSGRATRLRLWVGTALMVAVAAAWAQAHPAPGAAARQWRELNERSILDEFVELLRIPNTRHDPASLRRNAETIARMFQRRGVRTQLLEVDSAPPVVFGELPSPGAAQTLVFYAHYDGQPVQPGEWVTGDPFRPTLMSGPVEIGGRPIPLPRPGWPSDGEWRIYARSASDDKAAIIALAVALEALQARRVPIPSNLKFFFEGEEEAGSPHLRTVLERHRELLRGELWVFCDGPVHQNRQQQIAFGARGIAGLELTVYGPRRELHSGHYGNWAPNPAMMLARLLASMKDDSGKVLIEDFYRDVVPLGKAERQAIAEAPNIEPVLRREFWLPETAGEPVRLEEAINMPSLNVRGLESGVVGERAANIIPATATASLDIRLVKGMDHARTVERVIEHIRRQGFYVTESEPGEQVRLTHAKVCKVRRRPGYNAVRTPMDLEISQRLIAAIEQARGPVVKLPTLGGSLPLYPIEEILGAYTVIVPIANHDNNQHSHNENLRLQNLWDGIETMAALLALEGGEQLSEGAGTGR